MKELLEQRFVNLGICEGGYAEKGVRLHLHGDFSQDLKIKGSRRKTPDCTVFSHSTRFWNVFDQLTGV